jgi:hypothetical protein
MPGIAMAQQESIYNLVPVHQDPPHKQPLYHSKYPGIVDPKQFEMGVKDVKPGATFGKPLGGYDSSPETFIKSHSKEPVLPSPTKPTHEKMKRKPDIPSRTEVPTMGLVSDTNYVTSNAIKTILAKPPQAKQEFRWTQKPGFGEVPEYLQQNKSRVEQEKQRVAEYMQLRQHHEQDAHVTQMSSSERQELLRHLKVKWATVNTAYQKLPFSLDTPAKQKRKEKFEQQLTEIEKDIRLLEHGDSILVLDD